MPTQDHVEATMATGAGLQTAGWKPDPEVVAHLLVQAGMAIAGPLRLTRIAGGQSNPTFRVDAGVGESFVLRAKPAPASELLPSAHAIEREYRVMSALGAAGFAVPGMIACITDEEVAGRSFYLMHFVDGRVFRDLALPDLSPDERREVYKVAVGTMADLHQVEPAAVGLESFGRAEGFLARNLARWTKQYRASQTDQIDAMDELIEVLPGLLPQKDECRVIHGDFKLDNLVYHSRRPEVVATLDWELSTLGHPLTDLAYFCAFMQRPAEFGGLDGASRADGIPSETELLETYVTASGRTSIDDWKFHKAFNYFRMAAIVQGIKKRALDGIGTNPHALREGRQIGSLAAMGRRILNG